MIVEVFVAQCNCDDPLSEQSSLLVNREDRVSRVWDDCVEGFKEPNLLGDLPEKSAPASVVRRPPKKSATTALLARVENRSGWRLQSVIAVALLFGGRGL